MCNQFLYHHCLWSLLACCVEVKALDDLIMSDSSAVLEDLRARVCKGASVLFTVQDTRDDHISQAFLPSLCLQSRCDQY